MTFLFRIFGKKANSNARPKELVVFDDVKVVRTISDGKQETLLWCELEEIAIITTDEGPFVDDVFWALSGETTGCLVPSEAEGAKELLIRLQKLPGFNDAVVVQAMGSTENAKFICWRKAR